MKTILIITLLSMMFIGNLLFAQQDTTLVVDSKGNIGINNTTPASRLTITGNMEQPVLRLYSPKSSTGFGEYQVMLKNLNNGINDWHVGQNKDNSLRFAVNYGKHGSGPKDLITFTDNGYVGIGSTLPKSMLEVAGSIHSTSGGFKFPDGSIQTTAASGGGTDDDWTISGNNMFSNVSGNIGINNTTPKSRLTITGNMEQPVLRLYSPKSSTGFGEYQVMLKNLNNGINDWHVGQNKDNSLRFAVNYGFGPKDRITFTDNGYVGIGTTNPNHPLQMASGAHVTSGGVWTNASSRDLKENINELTDEEAMNAIQKLSPVKYNYKLEKNEEYLGFIAEDVPSLVAMEDKKSLNSMDIVALLTKVVQIQQKQIDELERQINFKNRIK